MKKMLVTGADIKRDNGSGYRLADAFHRRRFTDQVIYEVRYHGAHLDNSTAVSIKRKRRQDWEGGAR